MNNKEIERSEQEKIRKDLYKDANRLHKGAVIKEDLNIDDFHKTLFKKDGTLILSSGFEEKSEYGMFSGYDLALLILYLTGKITHVDEDDKSIAEEDEDLNFGEANAKITDENAWEVRKANLFNKKFKGIGKTKPLAKKVDTLMKIFNKYFIIAIEGTKTRATTAHIIGMYPYYIARSILSKIKQYELEDEKLKWECFEKQHIIETEKEALSKTHDKLFNELIKD